MAELATLPENRGKLAEGSSLVTPAMVSRIESLIDDCAERFDMPTEFVVPGGTRVSALIDVARTVVRRAERETLDALHEESLAGVYLNRLSDLLWALARVHEGESMPARQDRG